MSNQNNDINVNQSENQNLNLTVNIDNQCSICLNEVNVISYADGCLHKFCGRCIFEWARRSQNCPICRSFFRNIITNVRSDTDFEMIPIEERQSSEPMFNLVRDFSNWTVRETGVNQLIISRSANELSATNRPSMELVTFPFPRNIVAKARAHQINQSLPNSVANLLNLEYRRPLAIEGRPTSPERPTRRSNTPNSRSAERTNQDDIFPNVDTSRQTQLNRRGMPFPKRVRPPRARQRPRTPSPD